MITQRGSVTVELVLLTPVLLVLVLFGVYAGRASEALIQVRHAADQAARAASKGSRSEIETTALEVAERTLRNSGSSCTQTSIETSIVQQGQDQAVLVTVECTIENTELALLGTTPRVVRASSLEVMDRWRVDT